ncbi:MAG TPA: magnesium transporter CorA family protein [Polyangiaceae bacterium]|nr:magnesium transporter CorA family protein [Polyangiaceae bacterium]
MLARAPSAAPTLSEAVWIDLLSPSDAESAEVEAATNLRLPAKDDIEEIETSSRVYVEDGALYLSTPLLTGPDCMKNGSASLGCVLTPKRLVTLHFVKLDSVEELRQGFDKHKDVNAGDVFLRLLEIIVDHTADALERAGAELEAISHAAFRAETPKRRHARMSAELRSSIRRLGRISDGVSHLRDSLLGVGRVATFVHETGGEIGLTLAPARLGAVRGDIVSLNDYQAHLASKVQFLLDAMLGFISIQQNDIVKTLTVVSLVGVPPVLIAGIYGMNFRVMPELDWPLGYPFALALIVVSGLVPLGLMKWRGWM